MRTNDMIPIYSQTGQEWILHGWCDKKKYTDKKINFICYYVSSGNWVYIKRHEDNTLSLTGKILNSQKVVDLIVENSHINWEEEMKKDHVKPTTIQFIKDNLKKKELHLFHK